MSVRQGNNIIAGGNEIDPTPTSGSSNPVASGGVYTALAGKVSTGHEVIESQEPTALNNYTWYRKYADGWVEQGGIKNQASSSAQALTLPVEMSGSTYSVLTSVMDDNLSGYVFCVKVTSKTTTGFNTTVWGSYQQGIATSGYDFVWQVSGMAA